MEVCVMKAVFRKLGLVLAMGTSVWLGAGAAQAADASKVLNIYNWSDYIAEDTIKNFEKGFVSRICGRVAAQEACQARDTGRVP
jgi:hypothetical protein